MRRWRILAVAAVSLLCALPAAAGGMTRCRMTYNLEGWSFLYKEYRGTGHVTCENNQSARVRLVTMGLGVTFGKSEIHDGRGTFSDVRDISEIFGTYASVDGHAGATMSAEGYAMTKGEVSLALSGLGRGFDLGFSFSGFTITRE